MSMAPAARAGLALVAVAAGLIAVSVQGERARLGLHPGRYLAAAGPPVWQDTPGMNAALPTRASVSRPSDGPDVVLSSAAGAEKIHSYHGTQLVTVSVGSQVRSVLVDVSHRAGVGTVMRVWAGVGVGVDPIFEPDLLPRDAALSHDLDLRSRWLLDRNYLLSVEGEQVVVGRRTTVVLARRRDGVSSARFWVDEHTGVTLRREVRDAQGRLLRSSVFVDIDLNPPAVTTPTPQATEVDGQPITLGGLRQLRGDGWVAPSTLPDGFGLFDARVTPPTDGGEPGEIHLSYTDGLAAVSLFEQQGRLDTPALDGWRSATYAGQRVWALDAVPERISWSSAGVIYTLVSDTPWLDIGPLVGALPHGGGNAAVLTRLRRGLARVGSWLDPLE